MSTTLADFQALDDDPDEVRLSEEWPPAVRALRGLAAVFVGKVSMGEDEPEDILNGFVIGDSDQGRRFDWRVYSDEDGNIQFQRNVGLPNTPTWETRLTIDPETGIGTYAPLVHTHSGADLTSGTIPDARIAQSSIDQHATSTPAPSRVVMSKNDGQLDEDWISQESVDQHATEAAAPNRIPLSNDLGVLEPEWISQASVDQHATVTPTAARIPLANGSGDLADGWISQSSVDQHATATPTASRVPLANGSGKFADGWISQSSVDQWSKTKTNSITQASANSVFEFASAYSAAAAVESVFIAHLDLSSASSKTVTLRVIGPGSSHDVVIATGSTATKLFVSAHIFTGSKDGASSYSVYKIMLWNGTASDEINDGFELGCITGIRFAVNVGLINTTSTIRVRSVGIA